MKHEDEVAVGQLRSMSGGTVYLVLEVHDRHERPNGWTAATADLLLEDGRIMVRRLGTVSSDHLVLDVPLVTE